MNKKELRAKEREIILKMRELRKKSRNSNDLEELKEINLKATEYRNQLDEIEDALFELEETQRSSNSIDPNIASMPPTNIAMSEKRGHTAQGHLNVLGTYGIGSSGSSTRNNFIKRSDTMEITEEIKNLYEKRGEDLKEKRSVEFNMNELMEMRSLTVSTSNLVVPKQYSNTLNPAFNQVSAVIDLVHAVPLQGGESYDKGFVVGYGEGAETGETADYTETDPTMDYVTIGKSKITAYAEMSDESIKLPNVDYQAEVAKAISTAIRKKISKQILIGAGGTNQITGIFNAPANVIPVSSDLTISAINEDTLDKIVIGYGGDEEVEGDCYLILNKKDLSAFSAIRDANGQKIYKIKKQGNTGTISSDDSFEVPFIINSACPALSDVSTVVDTYCMAYGKVLGYEMPVFSQLTVEESRDYKFRSGQICYRGSVWTGGNVAMYKGFTRIKKVAV